MDTTTSTVKDATQSREYISHSGEKGIVTVRVDDYYPDSETGLGEPCERIHASLTFETETGRSIAHVTAFMVTSFTYFGMSTDREWVTNVVAFTSPRVSLSRKRHSQSSSLCDYSTTDPIRWDDVLADILEHVHYVFP